MRLQLVPLAIVLSLHALVVAAMLSALQVGAFSMHATRETQLERASPVATVQAFISTCPQCRSATPSREPLELPATVDPHLRRLRVDLPVPEAQWGAETGSMPPPSVPSRAGIVDVRCEVHIHQNAQGRVQAIDFGSCTEDGAWQHALLRKIVLAAALATPSSADRPPELTLTLTTNRISAVLLARVLSDQPTARSNGTSVQIATWRQH